MTLSLLCVVLAHDDSGGDTLLHQLMQMQDELEKKGSFRKKQIKHMLPPVSKLRFSPWKISDDTADIKAPAVLPQKMAEYGIARWPKKQLALPSRNCVLGLQQLCSTKHYLTKKGCLECAEVNKFELVHPRIGCNQYMARAVCHARGDYKGCFDFQYHHCGQVPSKKDCQNCVHHPNRNQVRSGVWGSLGYVGHKPVGLAGRLGPPHHKTKFPGAPLTYCLK
jgi:hypothetical protein